MARPARGGGVSLEADRRPRPHVLGRRVPPVPAPARPVPRPLLPRLLCVEEPAPTAAGPEGGHAMTTGPKPRDRTYGLPRVDGARRLALTRLGAAIADAHQDGQVVPCCGRSWRDWTDDNPDVAQRAADACRSCPVLDECTTYVTEHHEIAGTWAGEPAPSRARGPRFDRVHTFAASVSSPAVSDERLEA